MQKSDVNQLWEFSLAFYSKPAVDSACLHLQDEYGLNVNLLMLCCWAGVQGLDASDKQLAALHEDDNLGRWHGEVVEVLRGIRKNTHSHEAIDTNRFRETVKALEIEAEHLEQDYLYSRLDEGVMPAPPGPHTLHRNLRNYCQLAASHEVPWEALQPLFVAAFPELALSKIEELAFG